MTHSSTPLLVILLRHSMSFSKCIQKNSGNPILFSCPFVTLAISISFCWLLQDAQMKAECMSALTTHTAGADRSLSLSGSRGRRSGMPRSYPVLVVSFLRVKPFKSTVFTIATLTVWQSCWRTIKCGGYHQFVHYNVGRYFPALVVHTGLGENSKVI